VLTGIDYAVNSDGFKRARPGKVTVDRHLTGTPHAAGVPHRAERRRTSESGSGVAYGSRLALRPGRGRRAHPLDGPIQRSKRCSIPGMASAHTTTSSSWTSTWVIARSEPEIMSGCMTNSTWTSTPSRPSGETKNSPASPTWCSLNCRTSPPKVKGPDTTTRSRGPRSRAQPVALPSGRRRQSRAAPARAWTAAWA
jgi:hypothetical protein